MSSRIQRILTFGMGLIEYAKKIGGEFCGMSYLQR